MQLSSEQASALARVILSFHGYLTRLKGRMEECGFSRQGRYVLIYERVCRAEEVLRDLVSLLNYETLDYVGKPPREAGSGEARNGVLGEAAIPVAERPGKGGRKP